MLLRIVILFVSLYLGFKCFKVRVFSYYSLGLFYLRGGCFRELGKVIREKIEKVDVFRGGR